ncbi:MAG: 5-dehydro-4-deoxy-D-glucuronate isomerase [Bacteroidetes bacterium]|nr:5-dehydro-4-deoxy-D-glucuronate isomerase [Bacteroidota bacterium]
MEIRYSPDPISIKRMTTEELRKTFLIDFLFQPDKIEMVYSDIDSYITGSAMSVEKNLKLLASKKEMAAEYFAERREIGIINVGGKGIIKVDGKIYSMEYKDGLYIGKGSRKIEFESSSKNSPAKFYISSYPAHKKYPTKQIKFSETEPNKLGREKNANKRTIYKYIHEKNVRSCQLVMGLTELDEGSNWNTMPVHTHQRRSEVYFYFNLDENACLFHFLGTPDETRHIVIRNNQAVLSPSYSIHSGVGTQNYSFIWSMGGEN